MTKQKYLLFYALSDLLPSDLFYYPWPTAELSAIYRPFYLCDLENALDPSPVRKVVFIQVNQNYEETGNS